MEGESKLAYNGSILKVLDDGHITLVDHMGDDQAIVQAARVSYGDGTKQVNEDRALIRYLMKHHHFSPFEMCSIKFHVRLPIVVMRQLVRHRTGKINEVSGRYSILKDTVMKTDIWRKQSSDNKQGSLGVVDEWPENTPSILKESHVQKAFKVNEYLTVREQELLELSREVYEERLALGVAREQARKDLPLSQYTEIYWKMDLRNLFNFLKLRMDEHAQLEIREYANSAYELIKPLFPLACEAFEDFILESHSFSKQEINVIKNPSVLSAIEEALKDSGLKGRDLKEFKKKLGI